MTPMNAPRLILPFNSDRGEDYTVVLKQRLGVENIMWEGQGFVIEGDFAVKKAIFAALGDNLPPSTILATNTSYLDAVLLAALHGDESAGKIMAYKQAPLSNQVNMLKEWNTSEDELYRIAGVIAHG